MLTAVWTVLGILKIVGLVLLGLAGLLLVLLLLVLLVPIRYRAQLSYQGTPKGQAGVSWLCHLLSVKAVYEEKLVVWVRVLGIRIFRMEKSFAKTEKDEAEGSLEQAETSGRGVSGQAEMPGRGASGQAETPAKGISEQPEAPAGEESGQAGMPAEGTSEGENTSAGETSGQAEAPENRASAQTEAQADSMAEKTSGETDTIREGPASGERSGGKRRLIHGKKTRKKRKTKKKKGFSFRRIYDKLKEKLRRIRKLLTELREKKDKLIAFVRDPANQRTFHLLRRQVWKLCRHIFPGRISGRVRFGFDDPAKTGQVLAYISPFYALYARRLEVIPVFEESVMEGAVQLRGRIRIGTLIVIAVRMLLDKNFRALLKKFLKA